MNVQNAKELTIEEGDVRTIHDSDGKQLWGRVAYDTKYAGDASQSGTPSPDSPVPISVVQGTQTITLTDGEVSDDYTVGLTGKNLFDSSLLPTTWNNANVITITLKLKPNTKYTMSSDIPLAGGSYADIFVYDNTGTGGTASNGVAIDKPVTITTLSDGVLKVGYRSNSGTTISRETYWFQIEEGETATSYTPYFAPIELAKIGTYQDYIYKNNGNWYVHNAIGVSQLGSLTWSYSDTATANKYRMYTSGLSGQYVAPASNADTPLFISNYFVAVNANNNYNNTVGVASNPSGTALYAYHPDYTATTSPPDFKTWLTNNGVVLYYALKTTADTQITDATLISQLEAIHEWLTRYGYQSSVVGSLPIIISQTNL